MSEKAPEGAVKKAQSKKITIRHTLTSKLRMVKANPLLDLKGVENLDPGTSRRSTIQTGVLPLQRKPVLEVAKKAVTEQRQAEKKTPLAAKRSAPVKRLFTVPKDKAPRPSTRPSTRAAPLPRASMSLSALKKPAPAPVETQQKPSARARALSYCPKAPPVRKAALPKPATVNEKPPTLKPVALRTATPARPARSTKLAKENQPVTPAKKAKDYRPPTPGVRLAHTKSLSRDGLEMVASSDDEFRHQEGKAAVLPVTPHRQTPKSLLRSASAHNIRKSIAPGAENGVDGKENQPVTPSVHSILKTLRRSHSARSIRKSNEGYDKSCADETKLHGTIATPRKTVTFFSPCSRHSSSMALSELNSLKTPPASVLRERLNKWLAKRGKLSYSIKHLRCFGLHGRDVAPNAAEQKVPPTSNLNETITLESSADGVLTPECGQVRELEDAPPFPLAASSPEEKKKEDINYEELAGPEALMELRTLIFSGYPRDQCEQWLHALTKVRPTLDDLPEYWECLAALEEARGDYDSAIDCYGRAIVKGADEEQVGDSLDRLWEKFSQLSTSPSVGNRTPSKRAHVDPKQIFKSSVIRFALQSKAVKKFSADTGVQLPAYVCTPVRRSTRKSTSTFRATPMMKCVSSLNELEKDERENMEFHPNAILTPKY